jgi:DNA-binding PucR family transcriptional regulator
MERVFLDLLAREAPVAEFDAVVDRCRAEGADDATLTAVREAAVTALRIRAVLEERRRREQEIGALYETAGDLTQLRDVQRVLQAIVRRARQLMGADTAYLMLVDADRGEAHMRVTEGTVTAGFESVRMDLGAGLGGLVAKTASPYATSDYAADDRFDHTSDVDSAVGGEGLRAILGVPLLLGETVLGVLFAANRFVRPFTSHDVSLLSSLGAHAAIAIENARLFQETEAALEGQAAANAVVERAAEAHERLTTLVLRGGGLADVAEVIVELLGGRLLVLDGHARVLAAAGARLGDELHSLAVAQGAVPRATVEGAALRARLADALDGGTSEDGRADGTARWVLPVVGGGNAGALVLSTEEELGEGQVRTLERAALVTSLLLLHERSVIEAEQQVRGELLGDLLSGQHTDEERLRARARFLDLDIDRPRTVVVVTAPSDRSVGLAAAAALARDLGGIAGEHRGRLVLLVAASGAEETAGHVRKRLGLHIEDVVTAAGSGPATGPGELAAAFDEAERCLRVLLALGKAGTAGSAESLGLYATLLGQAGQRDVERFLARTLGPVLAYDEKRGTELVPTLEVYFAEGRNVTRAAAALHVHVNTLYQRLDRVGTLIGARLHDADEALDVHLALRLRRLRTGS